MENYKIDKKSKVLLWIFILSIVISIFFTYKRTMIDRDFYIVDENNKKI